jgi:photoactive yellow protein
MQFSDSDLLQTLEQCDATALDRIPFGVVKMSRQGTVLHYNDFESNRAGLSPQRVMGRDFFVEVAPCANNYMVAQRLFDEDSLDVTIDYVFTWKVRRTLVQLRLLKSPAAQAIYMLVIPRG